VRTLVWTMQLWGSWCSMYLRLESLLVLIQQMSSHRLKPHLRRQCRPASSPSALPHLAPHGPMPTEDSTRIMQL
jgi:hypothetical protein